MPILTDGRRTVAVFDLDGTLVDSLPDLAIALGTLLAEEGRRRLSADEVRGMVGDGALRLVERAFEATGAAADDGPALTQRFLRHYEGNAALNTRPFPGVRPALERLAAAGWRMAVCTNKPYRPSVEILEALDLARFFAAVVGGDSVPFKKPDPRHLAATLDAVAARPAQAVFIGDSANDVDVARGLGVPVVAVSFGYSRVPPAQLGADLLVESFGELPDALHRLATTPGRQPGREGA